MVFAQQENVCMSTIYSLHVSAEAFELLPVRVFPAFEKTDKGACEVLFVVSVTHMELLYRNIGF